MIDVGHPSFLKSVIKAFLLSFGSIFLSTRVGILTHEFLGHGLGALVLGGQILESRIFFFHGGWIVYDGIPEDWEWLPLYAGSVVSCSMGLSLVWMSKGTTSFYWKAILLVIGTGSFYQNAIYFFRSLHYGYGDGWELFEILGDSKDWLSLGVLPILGMMAWRWTPALLSVVAKFLGHPSKMKLFFVISLTFPLASGCFALLGEVELRWRDRGFFEVMRPLEKRVLDKEVRELELQKQQNGEGPLKADERRELELKVKEEHGEFPFDLFLGFCLVTGCLLGVKAYQPVFLGPVSKEVEG